jgi:CBS domain-containing protein
MAIRDSANGCSAALRATLQMNRAAARSCPVNDQKWRGTPVHKFLEATAGQYMTRKVKTVTRDTTMRELHKMFEADNFNCYPVREGDDIVGVVSNFDFLRCFAFNPGRMVPAYDDLLSRMVVDVMTPEFIYVDPATKLTRVLQLMVDHRMKSIPVLDAEQQLAGIIAREDIMRALTESTRG